jgi:hypothetical protein
MLYKYDDHISPFQPNVIILSNMLQTDGNDKTSAIGFLPTPKYMDFIFFPKSLLKNLLNSKFSEF